MTKNETVQFRLIWNKFLALFENSSDFSKVYLVTIVVRCICKQIESWIEFDISFRSGQKNVENCAHCAFILLFVGLALLLSDQRFRLLSTTSQTRRNHKISFELGRPQSRVQSVGQLADGRPGLLVRLDLVHVGLLVQAVVRHPRLRVSQRPRGSTFRVGGWLQLGVHFNSHGRYLLLPSCQICR